jgi:hypothetical protein
MDKAFEDSTITDQLQGHARERGGGSHRHHTKPTSAATHSITTTNGSHGVEAAALNISGSNVPSRDAYVTTSAEPQHGTHALSLSELSRVCSQQVATHAPRSTASVPPTRPRFSMAAAPVHNICAVWTMTRMSKSANTTKGIQACSSTWVD